MKTLLILSLLIIPLSLVAQKDSLESKLAVSADFRFRVEQDWNSQKSDGTRRDDRTRFRYRLRAGLRYTDKWYEFGFRVRTGNPAKQQDPQLTLGDGFKEFGTLPIGLEKAYFQARWSTVGFWVGKNTFPFAKSNELFWSDNVYPEGIAVQKSFSFNSATLDILDFRGGHFIVAASGRSLDQDAYFQGFQIYASFLEKRLELFPSLYLFRNIPDIPDGGATFSLDYSIVHLGTRIHLLKQPMMNMEFDYYRNWQDYSQSNSIPVSLADQRSGMVVGLQYGALKQRGDWLFKASYARLERFSAVDFLTQNDWARWDYSSFGSPDGRLTNFQGTELVAGYMINDRLSLKTKYYWVEQLIASGSTKENGSRIRFDIDIKM